MRRHPTTGRFTNVEYRTLPSKGVHTDHQTGTVPDPASGVPASGTAPHRSMPTMGRAATPKGNADGRVVDGNHPSSTGN